MLDGVSVTVVPASVGSIRPPPSAAPRGRRTEPMRPCRVRMSPVAFFHLAHTPRRAARSARGTPSFRLCAVVCVCVCVCVCADVCGLWPVASRGAPAPSDRAFCLTPATRLSIRIFSCCALHIAPYLHRTLSLVCPSPSAVLASARRTAHLTAPIDDTSRRFPSSPLEGGGARALRRPPALETRLVSSLMRAKPSPSSSSVGRPSDSRARRRAAGRRDGGSHLPGYSRNSRPPRHCGWGLSSRQSRLVALALFAALQPLRVDEHHQHLLASASSSGATRQHRLVGARRHARERRGEPSGTAEPKPPALPLGSSADADDTSRVCSLLTDSRDAATSASRRAARRHVAAERRTSQRRCRRAAVGALLAVAIDAQIGVAERLLALRREEAQPVGTLTSSRRSPAMHDWTATDACVATSLGSTAARMHAGAPGAPAAAPVARDGRKPPRRRGGRRDSAAFFEGELGRTITHAHRTIKRSKTQDTFARRLSHDRRRRSSSTTRLANGAGDGSAARASACPDTVHHPHPAEFSQPPTRQYGLNFSDHVSARIRRCERALLP